ncbi:MAG TPA: PP2C family serine/threonine-protein phosphatase [Blastocatellia bacterium]|nr:PP2C family serine/threonine-protein phosphatase [Blastocatellia bacterium]
MNQNLYNPMETRANDILVSVFARTDVGRCRAGNEDAFLIADLTTGKVGLGPEMLTHRVGERGSLLIVSDGMGGAVAGEIASELAVKTIRESLLEMPSDLHIAERLKLATEIANERIWNEAQRNPSLSGMGATVTAVLVQRSTAYAAQVGDSRAYLIRGERIKQITKDQSFAQALVDSGVITPEQMATVPQNVIMQALGTQPTVQVVLTAVELHRNDYLIVCSDGLSGKIIPDELCTVIHQSPDLTSACRRLVDIANERGGEDNITVIAAKFDGVGLEAANDSSSITGSFKFITNDFRHEQPVANTEPLSSLQPESDPNFTTVMMPSLATTRGARDQAADSATAEAAASYQPVTSAIPPNQNAAPVFTPRTTVIAKRQSNRLLWVMLSILILLILAGAGYLIYLLRQ